MASTSTPDVTLARLLEHAAGARRLANALLHDPEAADDVVQEALLVALVRPPATGWKAWAWLSGVVRNKVRERRRADRRQARTGRDLETASSAGRGQALPQDVPELAERMATQKQVFEAVLALPQEQRQVVWLRHFEGLAPRHVASRLALPVETVRTRHRRALERLRHVLAVAEPGTGSGGRARWALALLPLAEGQVLHVGSGTGLGGFMLGVKAKVSVLALVLLILSWFAWRAVRPEHPDAQGGLPADATAATTSAPRLEGRGAGLASASEGTSAPVEDLRWLVQGVVVGEDGSALAGAVVSAGPERELDVDRLTWRSSADSGGCFTLRVPPDVEWVRCVAQADGHRPEALVVPRGEAPSLRFRLLRRRALHLRVCDGDSGEPLPAARCESFVLSRGAELASVVHTDADGRAVLLDPEDGVPDTGATVRVLCPGYVPLLRLPPELLGLRGRSAERPLNLFLRRGAGLTLRVVDDEGRPVAGAEVRAWSGRGASILSSLLAVSSGVLPPGLAGAVPLGTERTLETGRVTLGVPAVGEPWCAVARVEKRVGFAWGKSDARGPLPVAADVRLHARVQVRGHVLDEVGNPLVGAWVRFEWGELGQRFREGGSQAPVPPELFRSTFALSDAAGRFHMAEVPLRSDAPGTVLYGNHGDRLGRLELPTEPPPADGALDVVLRLEPSAGTTPLTVRVLDASTSSPIAGAAVTWQNQVPTLATDAAGRAVRIRPRDARPLLSVVAKGFAPYLGAPPLGDDDVEVRLHPARSLRGRVRDDAGRPLQAYVDVYEASAAELADAERSALSVHGPRWLARAESGDSGHFELEGLPPGPLYVRTWLARGDHGSRRWPQVDRLVAGADAGDVVFPAADVQEEPLSEVSGAVYDGDGTRLTHYQVSLEAPGLLQWAVQTGWEFRFAPRRAGAYVVVVSEVGGSRKARLPVTLSAGRDVTGLRVVLAPTQRLALRLAPPEGTPTSAVAGLALSLLSEGRAVALEGGRTSVTTDAQGRVVLAGLAAGAYRLELAARSEEGPSWQPREPWLEVKSDQAPEREIAVVMAGRLVLLLLDERFASTLEVDFERRLDPTFVATGGATVRLLSADGVDVAQHRGLCRGRHVVPWALLPGRYDLVVSTRAEGEFRAPVVIDGGRDTEVQVLLEPAPR